MTASKRRWAACVLAATILAACGAAHSPSPTISATAPTPSATPDNALHLVVIGDSIPFGGHFCPGCTAFVDQYAATLQARTGRPVDVANRSRDDGAGMLQIETQVTHEATLRAQIAAADVVIVSVGYNNALPDPSTGIGCTGDIGPSIETYVTWALAAEPACLQDGIDTYAKQYDRIFSAITKLRVGAPTLYIAINVHDGNLGDPAFVQATISDKTRAELNLWMIAAYDRWNAMLCDRADQHGFVCVDVYHGFNGPAGDHVSGANTVSDGAHPSQAGNDLIASLLAKIDTPTLGP